MNNQLELFVNGTSDTVGQIDLYGDEPISLSISVADIKDISKRNSTFSQTFTIPANKNNNILLNHIFNIGSDSTFDPSKKTPCYMLNDSIPVFTGNFQLTKINVQNRNVISYECVVYGDTIDLVKTLGDQLLTDLDFSELNHISNTDAIMDSWTASTKELGYYYPLIDYGYDFSLNSLNPGVSTITYDSGNLTVGTLDGARDNTKNWTPNSFVNFQINITSGTGNGQVRTISSNSTNTITLLSPWSIIPDASSTYTITNIDTSNPYSMSAIGMPPSTFKPAISNKYLFDKIIREAGFTYDSALLNSEVFTETIMPYNGPKVLKLSTEVTEPYRFMVSTTADASPSPGGISVFTPDFNFNTWNPNGDYNNSTKKYTSPINQNMSLTFRTTYSFTGTPNPFSNTLVVKFYRGGSPWPFYEEQVGLDPNTFPGVRYNVSVTAQVIDDPANFLSSAQTGETFTVTTQFTPFDPGVGLVYHAYDPSQPQYHGTQFFNTPSEVAAEGGLIEFNSCIPKNVKQIDYIKSIIMMFNLMVIPNKDNPKKLTFIPRKDYYSSGIIKNWTDKVDHSSKIEETLISEQQAKQILFTYKNDKDYYNTFYTDDVKEIYGQHKHVLNNEWVETDVKKNEIAFSPTPMDSADNTIDIITPKIGKNESNGTFGFTDSNIRFLRKNPTPKSTVHTITLQGPKVSGLYTGITVPYYPYAGHLDDPFESSIDYNFGTIQYAFYVTPGSDRLNNITPNTLVANYWQDYLDDLTDKNSKLIKCKIYLTPNDIAQFNYNDTIFIDGLTDDGGHYFIVNKITYIPTANQPSQVELIRVNRKPTELRKRIDHFVPIKGPIKFNIFTLGKNSTKSSLNIINGVNNAIGKRSDGSTIIGNNNIIADDTPNVTIINGHGHYVDTPFVTIVGNTYFAPDGSSFILYNDIESGQDTVINPFSTQPFNDFNLGQDAVLNFGSMSAIKDVDSQEDSVF